VPAHAPIRQLDRRCRIVPRDCGSSLRYRSECHRRCPDRRGAAPLEDPPDSYSWFRVSRQAETDSVRSRRELEKVQFPEQDRSRLLELTTAVALAEGTFSRRSSTRVSSELRGREDVPSGKGTPSTALAGFPAR
jgi:hypothetical protein